MAEACDDCGKPVEEALARTVRLTVDRSQVDAQRLCPECFADWIARYQEKMQSEPGTLEDDEGEIIID